MRKIVAASLALAAIALTGCQKAPMAFTAAPKAASAKAARSVATDPYPVTVGSKWEYVLSQVQPSGAIKQRPMSMAITQATPHEGGLVEAVLERQYESWAPPATRVMHYPDKVVLQRLADPIEGPSLTIMHLPFEADAKWPGRPYTGGNSETIHAIAQVSVTVPAGTFQAYKVDHEITYAQGTTDKLEYWYTPGVGCVKMIERTTLWQGDTPMHLEVTGELTKYTIAEPATARPSLVAEPANARPSL